MIYIIMIYFVIATVTSISSFGNVSWDVSASGLICPLLALFAGSGLRGSLYGDTGQKVGGAIMATIFIVVATYWISKTGYFVVLFEITINGTQWLFIGLLVGFIFTPKSYAVTGSRE